MSSNDIGAKAARQLKWASFSSASVLRLSRIGQPILNGDCSQWLTFWKQYQATIQNNASLLRMKKFRYLRRYLAYNAASAIAGIPTTEARYCTAAGTLNQRYGDRRKIEKQHLSALGYLPHVKSVTNTKRPRKVFDTTQLHLLCFEVIGVSAIGHSAMLSMIFFRKCCHTKS